MDNKRYLNEKLWFLGIMLAWLSFINYFSKITGEYHTNLVLVLYILFFVLTIFLIREFDFSFINRIHGIFIIVIVIYNLVMNLSYESSKFEYIYNQSFRYFFIFIITMLGFSFIKSNIIYSILKRYYFIAFLIGLIFLIITSLDIIDRNKILNENTWGFFLAPYFIYLFVTREGLLKKVLIYSIGIILIYLSDAITALVAFATLPIYILTFNKVKRPRLIISLLIILSSAAIYWLAIVNSDLITRVLSYRNLLWGIYLENIISTIESVMQGTGRWNIMDKGIAKLYGLGSHNTLISLLHFNGIIVLGLYILFIVFGIRKNSTRFTVSDGVIYLSIVFQFTESNIPLFSFIFPAFIFMANMLINKESEEAEKRLEAT